MGIKFTFLIDNKPGKELKDEHGLSILIETADKKILFDTGRSKNFADNANNMGIELGDIDFAMISHGHYDHGDGLQAFCEKNKTAPVYIHPEAVKPDYYSTSRGGRARYIGINTDMLNSWADRFSFTDESFSPAEGIRILPCTDVENRGPIFNDGNLLKKAGDNLIPDTFDHEIYMIIERENDYIIISGCSHNNVIEIIKHSMSLYKNKTLTCVIGGFHLPDLTGFTKSHRISIESAAEELKLISGSEGLTKNTGVPLFLTGHCTGDTAKLMLKEVLGNNIDFFHTGLAFSL